jgi:hypothetical protein
VRGLEAAGKSGFQFADAGSSATMSLSVIQVEPAAADVVFVGQQEPPGHERLEGGVVLVSVGVVAAGEHGDRAAQEKSALRNSSKKLFMA